MTQDGITAETKVEWRQTLRTLGEAEGFFEELGRQHSALHVARGKTLIVTFENLDHVFDFNDGKLPWGYDFVTNNGWSLLGLMAHDWTWYRDEAVLDFFDRLAREGFFEQFEKVVFYGASMGAYAAAAFSAAAPGATVVLISPQATLSRDDASWETRYRKAWSRDFSGRYGYAPDMLSDADKVYLFYDPLAPLDAMHAALFRGANVLKLRCRYFGHRIASMWGRMGVLKPIVEGAITGTLSEKEFYHLLRERRELRRYQREMLERLEKIDRPGLIVIYCRAVLARSAGPRFRQAMTRAQRKLSGTKSQ
ncbi:phosphoadenosine phosphosulfate reductase [Celeribacter arenosi]|uniref:Phosphoadenosine phosphosulfate reductase n=1 Tax=Celeribacter arenosi TaxID=792649 RepID=A0ABP7K5Y3_9RHOB